MHLYRKLKKYYIYCCCSIELESFDHAVFGRYPVGDDRQHKRYDQRSDSGTQWLHVGRGGQEGTRESCPAGSGHQFTAGSQSHSGTGPHGRRWWFWMGQLNIFRLLVNFHWILAFTAGFVKRMSPNVSRSIRRNKSFRSSSEKHKLPRFWSLDFDDTIKP